jgi:malonyl CoA-acyl carrier protein transacylase
VISELSKVPLYSAAIDPQTLQSCLDTISKEYKDFGPDVLDNLNKKVVIVGTSLGTFNQVVNDFDKTIERKPPPP